MLGTMAVIAVVTVALGAGVLLEALLIHRYEGTSPLPARAADGGAAQAA